MSEVMSLIREYQGFLEWLGVISLLLLIVTVVIFPLVIIFLPQDYFIRAERDPSHQTRSHPVVWWTLVVLKNILGFVLVLAGLAMLLLPGQGLLTILLGTTLMNFPGKYKLERRLVSQPTIAKTLNRIRSGAGRPRLTLPDRGPVDDGATP